MRLSLFPAQSRSLRFSYLLAKMPTACVLPFSFFVFAWGPALCQDATIVGTVTDPSGTDVPNAKVVVTNTDKNQAFNVTTNGSGEFVVPSLNIGHYSVKAEVPGFKSFEQNDIVLRVGDHPRRRAPSGRKREGKRHCRGWQSDRR